MIGVIAGDIIGSAHEYAPTKTMDFPLFDNGSRFTDDTVLTIATAHAILHGGSYGQAYRDFGRRYPASGYGGRFYDWMRADDARPYDSWGTARQ
jgi:ADP-ribosylglycohydrolase